MTYTRQDLAWIVIVLAVILITGAVAVYSHNTRTATSATTTTMPRQPVIGEFGKLD